MKKILVSLVSDQTIPNILAIDYFKPDELLFLSTAGMERKEKTKAIIETLQRANLDYERRATKMEVQEDSILDCHRKLEEWIQGKEDAEFIVNLTGGTKIMSIAVYEYFKDYGSTMIYVPIPKNVFISPFPKKLTTKPVPLELRLSVVQYLSAYGLRVINEKKLQRYRDEAVERKALSEWIVHNYVQLKNLLIWFGGNLRSHRDDDSHYLSGQFAGPTPEELDLLAKLGCSLTENETVSKNLKRSDIRYLTGGWLEEYCLNTVLELQGINDAVTGLILKNTLNRDNEFDVMFTKENALYFIECKSLDQQDDKKADILYKIGALQKDFGLRVESFLVTTSPFVLKNGKVTDAVKARAEQFNTQVIPPGEVIDLKRILLNKFQPE